MKPSQPSPLPFALPTLIIFPILHAFTLGLIPLELVQLYKKIIDILQMLNFIDLLEFINESQSADIKYIDLHLQLIPKE